MTTNSKIQISENELVFKISRSAGPGGQNVNKLNTKVALIFDIKNSTTLSTAKKQIILKKLANRLTKDKKLIITSQKFRTQKANRNAVVEKLNETIQKALQRPKKRKPTKPTKASLEKRLKSKKIKSQLKQQRRKVEM
ncbi:MAG: aminoacyl-tRNA hydrolase [Sedimentisphaerales bacterium]|nr:aminoacyl-tRNA hydrolase [Sedimentisphaerales bacterium]